MRLRLDLQAGLLGAALLAFGALGCTPKLGDKCVLSTDCSLRGDRACDTSQPGGYCTIRDCRGNTCPDDGVCVLFAPNVPGCGFDDRSPSRTGRGYCMATCNDDVDCRGGYVCSNPKAEPWSAVVLDQDTTKRVCIIPASRGALAAVAPLADAAAPPVCGPFAPDPGDIDASVVYDAAFPSEGGPIGEAGADSSDAPMSDASSDAPTSDASDAGAPDADPGDASDAASSD